MFRKFVRIVLNIKIESKTTQGGLTLEEASPYCSRELLSTKQAFLV